MRQTSFSALQRAEIAEIRQWWRMHSMRPCFSALQRAEIAEIRLQGGRAAAEAVVSVLFNEPKLLKFKLQRPHQRIRQLFQCSSTSRNC